MTESQLDDFLRRASNVTANYRAGGADWDEKSQFSHIVEEVTELMRAKTNLEELEEGCDVIFTVLTLFHLKGYDNYAIKTALLTTLKKIERRSEKYFEMQKVSHAVLQSSASVSDEAKP